MELQPNKYQKDVGWLAGYKCGQGLLERKLPAVTKDK